jgi:hypothetical protein
VKGREGDALPEEFRSLLRLPSRGTTTVDAVDAVPRGLPAAPRFPTDAMPEPCRALVTEASAAIGCPPEFVGLSMLVTLGTAVGNARVVRLKAGWEDGATIYAAMIADPGEKKTPAQKVATEPAVKLQARLREEYRRAADEHKREMRQHEVNKRDNAKQGLPADPEPEAPVMERSVVEDVTVERLADLLGETPRGILQARDELAGWVKAMDQYKSGGKGADRQFYLSAWSNNYVAVDRKNRAEPLMLQRPFVGVLGGIQPEILPEIGEGREDGLLDRFLFAYPDPVLSSWTDDEISDEARDRYAGLYGKLRNLHMPTGELGDPEPTRILFSPDAKEVLVQAIDAHRGEMTRPGFEARLKGPWSKLEAYLARLCLVLAVSRAAAERAPERIEVRDVLGAVVLLDYFKGMARRVHARLHGENPEMRLAEDVAAFLERRGGYFKGEPSVFHEQLDSEYKPPRPDELAKKLTAMSARFPSLGFEKGSYRKGDQSRRCWTVVLKNGVNGDKPGKVGA